jgi:acetyl esterase/lipase
MIKSLTLVVLLALGVAASGAAGEGKQAVSAGLHADIEYGQGGDEKLLLDASVLEGTGSFPVAILVHGGGWGSGDKEGDITPLLAPLTSGSFTWFSIDYRLAPKYRWPACYEDVETAIRWVKAHAAEYKGDPGRIALIGYSAGGELACLAAARAGEDMRVQAVVGIAPPTDIPADIQRRGGLLSKSLLALFGRPAVVDAGTLKLMREMSAIDYIHPGLPPFLLIHGTEDKSVLYSQSVNFQAKLKEENVPCDLVTVTGAPHRLGDWDKFDGSYKARMIAWLQERLGPPSAEGAQ